MSIVTSIKRITCTTLAVALLATSSLAAYTGIARAAVSNPVPRAQVSFTFDDGMQSAYTQAAPAMKKHGITGVAYVTTGCVGMTRVPNTCRADSSTPYMTWTQVKDLQNTYGWEIGSHTVTHPLLASSGDWAGQPNRLTPAQVEAELANSKTALANQGINAAAFASPYGDYDNTTLGIIAKYYTSHRGFADTGLNTWPHSDMLIRNIPVQTGVSVASVQAQIDQAIANNQWAVLTFHDIKVKASADPDDYQYSTANLEAIAAYVKTKQNAGLIRNVNASNGIVSAAATDNLLPNSSFDAALTTGGWRTDNPTAVTRNNASNGSFPSAVNSVRFAPGTVPARLFTPQITVNSNSEYVLKNYVKVQGGTGTGAIEFYIDEYDAAGNWISGQYKGAVSNWTTTHSFGYKPTTPAVTKANLQITNTAGSGITAHLDNSQWYVAKAGQAPTPIPQTNLVANGTFDAGIAGGWRSDNATVLTANAASQGSPNNVVNSVRFQAGTANAHLFSPVVTVDPAKTYSLSSYLKLSTLTSNELGFYVDEYDAAGNWISGQYKIGVRTVSTGDISFAYKPTSAAVAKSSLQFIVPANSGATGYYDDVRWYVNQ